MLEDSGSAASASRMYAAPFIFRAPASRQRRARRHQRKEHVRCADHLAEGVQDLQAGFEAKRSLDDGIKELLKGYRMEGRPLYRNAA